MGGRRSQMHLCVFSSPSLLYIFQEKNKLRRDQSHIWVNQMSSRAATYVSVCFWHFLSAVIGVFLSFFFFFLRLHRCLGEEFVQRSPPFLAGLWRFGVVCLKDTRAGQMLAVIERFEWSFCVKWKDLWWLMCWVSLMTLEFFERGFLKPSHIWKDTRVLVEKYKTEEWIICKKDFYFRRWEWIMTHLRSSPLSLSLSRSTATCAKLKFLSGCDMIGLLIRNETKPNLSLSLFQGWRCPGVAAGSINRPVKKCLALGPAINHLWLMMTDFLFKAPCLSCGIELQTRQVFRLEDIKSSNILGRLRAIREFTTET